MLLNIVSKLQKERYVVTNNYLKDKIKFVFLCNQIINSVWFLIEKIVDRTDSSINTLSLK